MNYDKFGVLSYVSDIMLSNPNLTQEFVNKVVKTAEINGDMYAVVMKWMSNQDEREFYEDEMRKVLKDYAI
jgi:predicted ATP-grasp superfamily ATP-dependent carboligase